MDPIEALSRAYHPEAWDKIDRLRTAAARPLDPASMWADFRGDMSSTAEDEAATLLRRMSTAVRDAGLTLTKA